MSLPFRGNPYSGSPLDRASDRRDDPAFVAGHLRDPGTLFVPVWRSRNLMRLGPDGAEAVLLSASMATLLGVAERPWALLGLDRGRAVFAVDLSAEDDPLASMDGLEGAAFADLREAAGLLPAPEAAILAHARALMHWRSRQRFCGACGAACEPRSAGHVMLCTGCGASHFPRTDPAVIMLVTCRVEGEERALLAHNRRFPVARMFSTLAGFVEPGESLEEAVAREVREEAGVRVGAVRYHSSQPWPFPSSIMLGFVAEAADPTLMLDAEEIAEARWFSRDDLREPERVGIRLPRPDSIARRLILDWVEQVQR
ncbi:NAD(+) diphosphatase [Elioraea thermophila]|uniref:NAD(+) diphosphatase n=1 Tax=Elioraea thermophila TaxID=2185104 RepID=UPI000DF26D86|nr:NAD(+) diphosphatase [Elioraea thermophila]